MLDPASHIILKRQQALNTRIDYYVDAHGKKSAMKWIPPFRACRAVSWPAATVTPSNTLGDWFHPSDRQAGWVAGTDYDMFEMGGYWVDMYLCSSPDATDASMGTLADGVTVFNYVSQQGVSPRVLQNITHFKTYLASRFSGGGFGDGRDGAWAGKGGLITDQHWFELWVWSRINRLLLHGNTMGNGASAAGLPLWHGDQSETGQLDQAHAAIYGYSVTGGGPASWDAIVSDFCGNRWELTDGLRLNAGAAYSAGKTINPPASYADPAYTAAFYGPAGVSGDSISSYIAVGSASLHGLPAAATTAGTGPMDGQGFLFDLTLERVSARGGDQAYSSRDPGALALTFLGTDTSAGLGARAVLVP